MVSACTGSPLPRRHPDIESWPCSSWTETTKLRGSDVWLDRLLRDFCASSCKARHAFHSWTSAWFPLPSKSDAIFTLDLCCALGLRADKSVLPHCIWTQWDYAIACLNLTQELLVSPWDYPQVQKKEFHLLKASLTSLICSTKLHAPGHAEETHIPWLEVLLHIDESVGFTSRQKEARLTIYTFCLKSCHQNSKGTLLASSMLTRTALPLRSWRAYSLEASGHLPNTYLVSYTKLAFFQGCQWQAWHSWDTRDSAVKHIAIFVLLKNSDIHGSSGMFYLCPDYSDRTEAAWKQSVSH